MSLSISKSAVILVLLGGVWWLSQDGGASGDEASAELATARVSSAAARAMHAKLELAVTSAANAADCGYTEVGYGHRTPGEAALHLVALMKSASAPAPGDEPPPPGTEVDYVEGLPGAAWQVAIRADTADGVLIIEGYGPDLSEPLLTRRVRCT